MIENDQLFVYKHRVGFVCTYKIARYSGFFFKFRVKLCHPVIVGKLTILFVDKYPNFENLVKYEYYQKHFKENFNLKFGRPHVDVCSECERHGTKLKDVNINDNAKRVAAAELMVHKRRAKKFYNKIKEAQTLCTEVMGLGFDYMQNMPLPYIPVQESFYYRQKGSNEVCTFLRQRLHNEPYIL
nr:unnamed protein product [Callosobruchus analis]